ncbi:MAG: DNA repair protein RecO [Bacteroidota bacterium]
MIRKTEGIVLKTLKHQDANLITTVYTREFGVQSYLLKGFRSTRSRGKHSYFQPLSIIEFVFQERSQRSLQKVTESKLAHYLQDVQINPVKLSLGLAMLEIFFDTVKEEEQNIPQYEFLKGVILALDQAEQRMIQLFIHFLLHHTRFLGFFPLDKSEGAPKVHFELEKGIFRAKRGEEAEDLVAAYLRSFLYSSLAPLPDPHSCQQIIFDATRKRFLIKTLFDYYKFHVDGFKYPQTIKVFAEVFGT